jgi:hypothetical protein
VQGCRISRGELLAFRTGGEFGTIARHFLALDALAGASDADIARVGRPWVTTGVDDPDGTATTAADGLGHPTAPR